MSNNENTLLIEHLDEMMQEMLEEKTVNDVKSQQLKRIFDELHELHVKISEKHSQIDLLMGWKVQ